MAISDYSATRDNNASVTPGNIRSNDPSRDQQIINAIRQLMADLADFVGTANITKLRVNDNTDVSSITQTNTPVQIGTYDASNIVADGNEVQARTNGVASALNLQLFGGNLVIGDADSVIQANGGKILFPGTQSPSTNANTLDDYEENTWIPALSFSGGNTGITYSIQTGTYVKIGQLVFIQGRIILTSKGSSTGQARISIPFTSANVSQNYTPISVGYFQSFSGLTGALSGYVETSNTIIQLTQHGATGVSAVVETHLTNTSDIIFSACYRANQ